MHAEPIRPAVVFLLVLAPLASALYGCGDAGGESPCASATVGAETATGTERDTGTKEAAGDVALGISGCSGSYVCRSRDETIDVDLRVVDGECWANDMHLMPNRAVEVGSEGAFWHPGDGGFTVDRDDFFRDLTCTTTTGGSTSGPKLTAPHCQGKTTRECKTCSGGPGCAMGLYSGRSYCGPIPCYELGEPTTCDAQPGCRWE